MHRHPRLVSLIPRFRVHRAREDRYIDALAGDQVLAHVIVRNRDERNQAMSLNATSQTSGSSSTAAQSRMTVARYELACERRVMCSETTAERRFRIVQPRSCREIAADEYDKPRQMTHDDVLRERRLAGSPINEVARAPHATPAARADDESTSTPQR